MNLRMGSRSALRMVLLVVAEPTMAVAADRDCLIPESAAGEMMKLQR
jgi:hypothetical protein